MPKSKLVIWVDQELLNNIKQYADANHSSLSELINAFLHGIPKPTMEHSPLVTQLTGTLPKEASIEEYKEYLEEKYTH